MKRVFRNIKFGMEQWKFRKGQIFFLGLQIMASFLLIGYMLQNFYSYQKLNEQITYLLDGKEIYQWRDVNDTE